MDLVEALAKPPVSEVVQKKQPKILVWDIENSPAVGEFWGKPYNTNIIRIVKPSSVICFAAKWLGQPEVEYVSDFHDGHDAVIERAWELIDEADALVSYNGKGHDSPHIMTEFKLVGYVPPTPVVEIDLYRVIRKFAFQQNKLSFVAQELGIGEKLAHEGHDLWVKCGEGDPAAWATMKKYNIQDTLLTDDLYWDVQPWIPQNMHPHPGLYGDAESVCGHCGSTDLVPEEKPYRTALSAYPQYRCGSCGGLNRGKKLFRSVDVRAVG